MRFRNSVQIGQGILHRGELCLWRTCRARYLGSLMYESESRWKHIIMLEDPMFREAPFIVDDTKEIVFKGMEHPVCEGQMVLC